MKGRLKNADKGYVRTAEQDLRTQALMSSGFNAEAELRLHRTSSPFGEKSESIGLWVQCGKVGTEMDELGTQALEVNAVTFSLISSGRGRLDSLTLR